MKKQLAIHLFFCLLLIFFGCQHSGTPRKIQRGDSFPQIHLPSPYNPEEQAYLGLSSNQSFLLHDVKAELIIVEVLNVYCHNCKRQVLINNKVYQMIEQDQKTKGRIKLLGIAVGNNLAEIQEFKDKYAARYPIIPDPEFLFHQSIGSVWTPYSIYVRKDPETGSDRVTDRHLGLNFNEKKIFRKLIRRLDQPLPEGNEKPPAKAVSTLTVEPVLTDKKMMETLRGVFQSIDGYVSDLRRIPIAESRTVYTCLVSSKAETRRLFAEMVSRSVPCDVCHDAHFVYVFDAAGKIIEFVSIRLSKNDNVLWNNDDVDKIRKKVVGRYIFESIPFDPNIDAVSSATITSAVIFDSLAKGQPLHEELKQGGYYHER